MRLAWLPWGYALKFCPSAPGGDSSSRVSQCPGQTPLNLVARSPDSRMDFLEMMGPVAIHRPLGVHLTQGKVYCAGHVSGLSRSYHVTFSHSHTHSKPPYLNPFLP